MKKEGLVPKTGKKKTDLQLDHIIPYEQGFILKIPPSIIGGRENLRYIVAEENRSKWDTFQSNDIIKTVTGDNYGLQ
jgi:hypothetical protein